MNDKTMAMSGIAERDFPSIAGIFPLAEGKWLREAGGLRQFI